MSNKLTLTLKVTCDMCISVKIYTFYLYANITFTRLYVYIDIINYKDIILIQN